VACRPFGAFAAVGLALILPERWVPFSGFAYLLLGAGFPLMCKVRSRSVPARGKSQ
jgi:hypothetical protein